MRNKSLLISPFIVAIFCFISPIVNISSFKKLIMKFYYSHPPKNIQTIDEKFILLTFLYEELQARQ